MEKAKISIAVVGEMPAAAKRLKKRRTVILYCIPDSAGLERLLHEGQHTIDLVLMRAPCANGLFRASYSTQPACSYPLCLMDDPPSEEAWAELTLTTRELLHRERVRLKGPVPPSPAHVVLRPRPGVVYVEQNGCPGLALGDRSRLAANPSQEWMVRRVLEYDPLCAPEQDFIRELQQEDLLYVERMTPEQKADLRADPVWRQYIAAAHVGDFILDFQDFLRDDLL